MAFLKTNSVVITVDGLSYDSLLDLGLAIHNTDYLRAPVQGTANLVYVAGHDGPLDTTDEIFGEQYFISREIIIEFGGIKNTACWDSVISDMRNKFEGKNVQLEFATMPGRKWKGRCTIEDFEHKRALGTFTFALYHADPYSYRDCEFTFTSTAGGVTKKINITRKTEIPQITTSAAIEIELNGETFEFSAGAHENPNFRLNPGTNTLTITGTAEVTISYTDRSL